jgi:hypothetical protein
MSKHYFKLVSITLTEVSVFWPTYQEILITSETQMG